MRFLNLGFFMKRYPMSPSFKFGHEVLNEIIYSNNVLLAVKNLKP